MKWHVTGRVGGRDTTTVEYGSVVSAHLGEICESIDEYLAIIGDGVGCRVGKAGIARIAHAEWSGKK